MAFDELKEQAAEAEHQMRRYGNLSADSYRLKAFKVLMRGLLHMTKGAGLAAVALIMLAFFSVAGALYLGEALNSTAAGFLIVGRIYLVLLILAYLFRHKIDSPIIRAFSEYYFDDE